MSQVITCPNCDKKLALRDELKGRDLICPQCKGRFTAPSDESQSAADLFDVAADEAPAAAGSDMAFLDNLGPSAAPTAAKATTKTSAPDWLSATARPAAARTQSNLAPASRAAVSRAKKKNDPTMLIYIGGGVAVVLIAVLVFMVMSSRNSGGGSGGSGGVSSAKKKPENIRWGLADSARHQLFKSLMTAVDVYGISKQCKEEWFRLADEAKFDRSHIGELLDEGFSRDDWDQPAPAHVTNQTRGTRMEWTAQRAHGSDPVLAM